MKRLMGWMLSLVLIFSMAACNGGTSGSKTMPSPDPVGEMELTSSGEEDIQILGETKSPSSDETSVSVDSIAAFNFEGPSTQEFIRQIVQNNVAMFAQPSMTEYEKVKAAYDYLIEIGYYTRPIALDVWRFRSAGDYIPSYVETRSLNMLLFGFGTCEDFASSLMMLLDEMGIDSRYMTGLTYTRGGGMTYHSWIQAKVDDVWYHLDVELDDGISSDDGMVNYRYFMKSDVTMSASHYWGQGLIVYGGDRLQPEQLAEIRDVYMGESCPQDYPTPAAKYIAVNSRPDTDTLREELLDEIRVYEETYGKLEYMELNIFPLVFVRHWYGNDQEPGDNYGNFVRSAEFIREYPMERLLIPPAEGDIS